MSKPNSQSNGKKQYDPSIPFFKSEKGYMSVVVTPELFDTITKNLKVGQRLFVNAYENAEGNKPAMRIVFGDPTKLVDFSKPAPARRAAASASDDL